jgi:hypothetical protein
MSLSIDCLLRQVQLPRSLPSYERPSLFGVD